MTNKIQSIVPPNPGGLCMCGCGQKTQISKVTNIRDGVVKGYPLRYLPWHHL